MGYFNDGTTDACQYREMPISWKNECPLTAGKTAQAWWLTGGNAIGATGELIKRQHGCYATWTNSITTPMAGAPTPLDTTTITTARFGDLAGMGPPNPDCLTITPPSWRTTDYFLNVKNTQGNVFNPIGLCLAGLILGSICLCGACCFFCAAMLDGFEE